MKKAHTLPHQSLVVICCVVNIYPFRRPDVKMKEKPRGVNRKMPHDGEEKSGKMNFLHLNVGVNGFSHIIAREVMNKRINHRLQIDLNKS
ncbi:hypothetical protein CQB02_22125 [Escherichia coli]|nr:hypothetical protein CQB02_22125 [Escherichia coli]